MYTIKQFLRDYPDDEACLADILSRKYPNWVCSCGREKLYKIKNRPVYACACGKQVNPLVGTPMQGTKMPLTSWFYAMYLMANKKNGLSAAELQRHLGCKYQAAWRMCYQIRQSMKNEGLLAGEVEVDESYIRAKPWRTTRPLAYNGRAQTVMGFVSRGGAARTEIIPSPSKKYITDSVNANVLAGSHLYTDGAPVYRSLNGWYKHQYVNHNQGEWVRDEVHTQNVENLWHGIKLGLQGTHKGVTPEYLPNYLQYFCFIYSERFSSEPLFEKLLARL